MQLTRWNSTDPLADLIERAGYAEAAAVAAGRVAQLAVTHSKIHGLILGPEVDVRAHARTAATLGRRAVAFRAAAGRIAEAEGWHRIARCCDCGGSGYRPGYPDDECCPYHGEPNPAFVEPGQ